MIGVNCPKCNTEYDDVFNFCPECAEPKPLEPQHETLPPDTLKPKKKLNIPKGKSLVFSIVALSLIVVLLATTVVFVVLYTGANSAKQKAESELELVSSAYMDVKTTVDKIMPLIDASSSAFLAQAMELMNYGNFTTRWSDEGEKLGKAIGELMFIASKYKKDNK